jgi:hypothetical protein
MNLELASAEKNLLRCSNEIEESRLMSAKREREEKFDPWRRLIQELTSPGSKPLLRGCGEMNA